MKYNYIKNMIEDIKDYIKENYTEEEIKENLETASSRNSFEEQIQDELWTADSVTGNGSGSYTFNTYEAEENIAHNLDLLNDAIIEFGGSVSEALERGAEYCDVTIRCYLLNEAISEALDELEQEYI